MFHSLYSIHVEVSLYMKIHALEYYYPSRTLNSEELPAMSHSVPDSGSPVGSSAVSRQPVTMALASRHTPLPDRRR